MTAEWRVTCDGSALTQNRPKGELHPGGWAAVVEHGSDGQVVRGMARDTTSTRMELVAAIEGLRIVPDGAPAVLNSDCTVIWSVHDRWLRRTLPQASKDIDLWRALAGELDRLGLVQVVDERGPVHRRCHGIAQAEARKLGAELGLAPAVLPREEQERRAATRRERKEEQERRERHRLARHLPGCSSHSCVPGCAVFIRPFRPIGAVAVIPHHKWCREGHCTRECIHYGREEVAATAASAG